jgi:hypothetical protein
MCTNGGKDLGYKFGYRHQFGLITDNCAKLLMGSHLWIFDITLNFAYLSQTYGILERLKIRRRQLHGGNPISAKITIDSECVGA